MTKRLIVNADDFGLSPGINRGILKAHDDGIVTSASLMVLQPAAVDAAAAARERPALGLGLHLDVGEWAYANGEWRVVYMRAEPLDEDRLAAEVGHQFDRFHKLVGRPPTHLDSHQHAHRREPLRSIVKAAADALALPLRHATTVRYCGDFYGQTAEGEQLPNGVSAEHLCRLLAGLADGVTELVCHPGYADDVATMYRDERAREVGALCHPSVRRQVDACGINLCSFGDLLEAAA